MRPKLKYPIEKLKPWGREIWFACERRYAGKILELKKGHAFSLQFHEKKAETQLVIEGKIEYFVSKAGAAKTWRKSNGKSYSLQRKILRPGDKIDFPPYTIHRARALEDSIIFEVSSPELNDVIKLADDYGRSGKGNNEKLDRLLALKMKKKS